MISKNIFYGSIDIDTDEGKIWINCPECIIRMKNIRFNRIEEKYSMIDINGVDAWMLPESSIENPISDFIENLLPIINQKLVGKSYDETKVFLESILNKINEEEI